jgi:DNA-binding PucR family transcriptional regulator
VDENPDVVSEATKLLARRLNDDLGSVSASVSKAITDSIPELQLDQRLQELMRASVESNVENIVHMLAHAIPAEHMEAPSAAMEYARRLAQNGIPIHALVRAYRVGQRQLLKDSFEQIGALYGELDALRIYESVVVQTFSYIDWISETIIITYQEEREHWLTDQQVRRSNTVRQLLKDQATNVPAAERLLNYRFEQWHVGAAIWTDGTDEAELGGIERSAAALARQLCCCGAPLVIAQDRSNSWAWFPFGAKEPNPASFAPRIRGLGIPIRVSLGSAQYGFSGFRATLRQAECTREVALALGESASKVLTYPEISSVALLVRDLSSTKEWVEATLGTLAIDDENHARLRETLRVFLAHGSSYTAAAIELALHKNSVKYRVERATAELGRGLDRDRLDIELALAACRWLGKSVLRSVTPTAGVRVGPA